MFWPHKRLAPSGHLGLVPGNSKDDARSKEAASAVWLRWLCYQLVNEGSQLRRQSESAVGDLEGGCPVVDGHVVTRVCPPNGVTRFDRVTFVQR